MVYKNFLTRLISSFFLIFVYLFLYFFYSDKIIYFVTLIYVVILIEIIKYFKKYKLVIISYILISFFFVFLYFYFTFNPFQFTIIILCISFFDSSCYLVGKKFGKNKIHIAPLVDHNRSNEYEFDVNGEPYKMVQIILAGLRQAVESAEQPIAFLSFNRIIKLGGPSNIELQKRMGAAPVMPEMSMLMSIHLNNATVAAIAVEAVIALCDHPHNLTLMHKSNICDNVP